MKQRVNVSRRVLKDGVKSLYLDYRINGKRVRENLKLYLYDEQTQADKLKNSETIRIANAIRDKKEFELEQIEAGIEVKSIPKIVSFRQYAQKMSVRITKSTKNNYISHINAIERFLPEITINEFGLKNFEKMIQAMIGEGYSPGTIRGIAMFAIGVIRKAQGEGLIQRVPNISGLLPKLSSTIRQHLTLDELRILDNTPLSNDDVKRAFLFCCFTGLRSCDVQRLTPSMITDNVISISQHKTREPVRVPITANAMKYLDDVDDDELYFHLPQKGCIEYHLRRWMKAAGIAKKITFHCSRHTFAVLALSNGADIYVVSQLLGHTDVKTTQIYAKAVDSARKKAVNLIPKL